MDETLRKLVDQLDLERLEVNLFRGQSADHGGRSVFGGQVVGQALAAAARTIDDGRIAHSLHAYFLLPGDVSAPIVYEVDRLRDGRSFSARRVQAIQHGRPILSMIASFHADEPGLAHQAAMPEVPAPESLPSMREIREGWLDDADQRLSPKLREVLRQPWPIEFRPVQRHNPLRPAPTAPAQQIWFRAVDRLADDPMLHRCLLAYASDYNLIPTALRPHGKSWLGNEVLLASIDHALWFHRPARIDEWLLYAMDSPSAQGARGLARGQIFSRGGELVASVAQEGLMRVASERHEASR